MGVNASQLDRRVQFQRAALVDDGFGNILGPFQNFGAVTAASRRDVSDAEKMAAGRLQSEVTARFRIRSSQFARGLLASDRLICDGQVFNILGIKEAEGRGMFLEITAVAAGGQ